VIIKKTGSFHGGLVFAGVSLFISAMLLLALPKRTEQHAAGGAAMKQPSPPVMPTADTD
jgi:hypothetical protein